VGKEGWGKRSCLGRQESRCEFLRAGLDFSKSEGKKKNRGEDMLKRSGSSGEGGKEKRTFSRSAHVGGLC